jgi:hypothetical protein
MGRKGVFGNNAALYRRAVLAAFLIFFLSGCGASLLNDVESDVSSVLWKHRDLYVRIESQDRGKTAPLPNDHPAIFSVGQLSDMLGALEVQFEDDEKPASLFTFKELEILAPAISQGLAKAGPRQDVTFAIVGIHRGLISFSHDRAVITGRVFVQDGKLNLIVGKLHEEYDEREDRRTLPFLPGSRSKSAPLPQWGKPWKVVAMQGVETRTVAGVKRHDWLVLNPDPELWKAAIAEKKEAKETAKEAFREASEVRETSAQLETEQQQLRTELEQMKQTIQEMKQAPVKAAPPAATAPAPAPAPAAAPAPGMSKIEERLDLLKKLKSKGLITEEEYQAKKQEILDSL